VYCKLSGFLTLKPLKNENFFGKILSLTRSILLNLSKNMVHNSNIYSILFKIQVEKKTNLTEKSTDWP
jgi:hypothetical protein